MIKHTDYSLLGNYPKTNHSKNNSLISLVVACALALLIFACPDDEPSDNGSTSTAITSLSIAGLSYNLSDIDTSTEGNATIIPLTVPFTTDWTVSVSLDLESSNSSANLPASLELTSSTTDIAFAVTTNKGIKQEYILRITNGLTSISISKKGDADAAIDWGDTVTITPNFPSDKTIQGDISVEILREGTIIDDTATTKYLKDNTDGTWDFAFTNPADKDNHVDTQRMLITGKTRYEFRFKASADDDTDLTGATVHQLDNQGIRFTVKNLDLSALASTKEDGAHVMDLHLEFVGVDKIADFFANLESGNLELTRPSENNDETLSYNEAVNKIILPSVMLDDNSFYVPFWTVFEKDKKATFSEQTDDVMKIQFNFGVINSSFNNYTALINFSYDISGENAIQEDDSFILYFSANATNIANADNSGLFPDNTEVKTKTTTLNITKGGTVTVQ